MKTALKNLLFPVRMELIKDELGIDAIGSCEYGIFADLDGKSTLLNTCSDTYELLPNSSLFPVVEKILTDAKIKYTVSYKMLDFSRFDAEFDIQTGGVSVGNSTDLIYPKLIITHSYNGLLKYKMTFGYFRMICSNGLVVPVEGMEESNFTIVGKHTAKILKSLDGLLEKIQYFTKNNEKFTEKFIEVADRWVEKWEDRVLAVVESTSVGIRGAKWNEKTQQYEGQIFDKIREEAAALNKGKVNDWLIYNGINFHIFNAVTSKGKEYDTAPNLRRDADKKVWDTIYKYPNRIPKKKKVAVA